MQGGTVMKLLVTGFEPMRPMYEINPSWEAVKLLPEEIEGAAVVKACLPVAYGRADRLLEALLEREKPAALLCVAAMATAEAPVATGETAWLRGKPVATYTCAGKTVIPVSALGEYGFDVENGDALKITVNDAEITAEGAPATAGDTLAEVKAETTATLDGQPVVAYTLEDGDAVIALDDCFAYNAEKLSGIDLIVIGTSDLEKSKDFFVTHMELNVVAEGTMDAASVKALYGQEGEAKYAMVMNNVNSTKLMLIEFSEKTGKTTREGFHAWDYGYFDVAWRCNDIDAMYEELTGAGYSFECEPFSYTTSWSGNAVAECVAYGPDGVPTTMILKTTQEFDTKFYNMVDAVLVVDDMASAVDWYTNVMGMDLVYDAPVEKGLVDRVLGIEGTDITVRMGYFYGSYANGQSTLIEILDYSEPGVSMTEQGGSVPGNGGIFTQAFETKDLDKLLARCEAFGYKTASERMTVTLESVGEIDTVLVSGVNGTLYQFYQVK